MYENCEREENQNKIEEMAGERKKAGDDAVGCVEIGINRRRHLEFETRKGSCENTPELHFDGVVCQE